MRFIVVGLALALATIPAAQAQQLAIPTSASQPDLRRDEAPTAAMRVDVTPAPIEVVESGHDVAEAKAARQISARNVLAIIGAVVVGVALFALFS